MDLDALLSLLAATLRTATPLILCAMGGLFSERSGIIDVGLEGKMLIGAFAGATVAALTGSAHLGLLAAIAAAGALAAVHALATIVYGGNQVVSGVAVNMIASGVTIVFGEAWFRQGGQTPPLPADARFMPLPGAGHNALVYAALASVPLVGWIVGRTRFGLRLRAVGEAPDAVEAAGIGVVGLRTAAVLACGLLTGVAGAYLSLAQNAGFNREMSAGQGYIALAALIFGKWRPWPTLLACLLFGALDAVAIRLQGVRLAWIGEVPVQLIQVMPYGLTVVLLAGFIGRATPPRALGVPFVRGH